LWQAGCGATWSGAVGGLLPGRGSLDQQAMQLPSGWARRLTNLVLACLEGRLRKPTEAITIAHEQGWELQAILGQIAHALGERVTFVPVPWQCVWLALRSLELAGVQTRFRSDSLISMVYQNPCPAFASAESLGLELRPFRLTPNMSP
jgi:hypothetical protein